MLVFPQPRGRPTFKLNCPLSAVYCTAAGVVEEDTYCDHYFRAPEVFGETGYTTKADVFSFGVMLADIVLQYMAVPGYPAIPNPHDYFGMDWHRRNQEAAVRLSVVCPPLGDVLTRCCAADPADRFRSMDAWLAIREISTVSPVLPSLAAGGSVEPMSESVTPPSPPVDDGCGSPPAAP